MVGPKYRNIRPSSRPDTGIRSPPVSGFAFALSRVLLEDRILSASTPPTLAPALQGSRTTAERRDPDTRGSCGYGATSRLFVGDDEVPLYLGWIYSVLCCDIVSWLSSRDSISLLFNNSVPRWRPLSPDYFPDGSHLASSNTSAFPRRDTSTV